MLPGPTWINWSKMERKETYSHPIGNYTIAEGQFQPGSDEEWLSIKDDRFPMPRQIWVPKRFLLQFLGMIEK